VDSDSLVFIPRRRSIGLTALIDVVFILLMFFMLSSSFNRWNAVDFDAPVAVESIEKKQPQIIILGSDSSLRLKGSTFSVPHYLDLKPEHVANFSAEQSLVILSEPEATVQSMVSTLEALKQLGVSSVTLGGVMALPGSSQQ